MNKIRNVLKINGYDKFKCIADKCKFTCCAGWDINVDTETYNKWNINKNLHYLLDNTRFIKNNGDNKYIIKKETRGICPLLSNEGLCNIVINHGDEYLSTTCKTFPRIENFFDDVKEMTLSCACPEVVNIISNMNEKIYIESNESLSYIEDLGCLKIRETLVNIFQSEDINIEDKFIISYEMLISILDSDDLTYDELIGFLENYKSKKYIKESIYKYKNYEVVQNLKIFKEINLLFIDMIENYRNVPLFTDILKDIYKSSKESNIKESYKEWDQFKKSFNYYNELIENCTVSKILSTCISDDLEEMIISLEIIILEYLLVRHGLFLTYLINEKEVNIKDIKDYIVIFSRIIGNNSDSVIEFLVDMFEYEILESDYIKDLILV